MTIFLMVLDFLLLLWLLACSYDCIRILTWSEKPYQMIANFIVMGACAAMFRGLFHLDVPHWQCSLLLVGLSIYYPTVMPRQRKFPRVHIFH